MHQVGAGYRESSGPKHQPTLVLRAYLFFQKVHRQEVESHFASGSDTGSKQQDLVLLLALVYCLSLDKLLHCLVLLSFFLAFIFFTFLDSIWARMVTACSLSTDLVEKIIRRHIPTDSHIGTTSNKQADSKEGRH